MNMDYQDIKSYKKPNICEKSASILTWPAERKSRIRKDWNMKNESGENMVIYR